MSDQSNGSQGQLFSDAAVGAPAYDEVDTDLVGYRGPTACAAAGITYRQLDYWARTGLVAPSVRTATGSGTQRLYSFRDILVLKVVKRLLDTGVSLQNIRKAVDHLRNRGIKDLATSRSSPTAPPSTSAPRPRRSSTCWPVARASSASPSPARSASSPASWPSCPPSASTAARYTSADDELSMRRRAPQRPAPPV